MDRQFGRYVRGINTNAFDAPNAFVVVLRTHEHGRRGASRTSAGLPASCTASLQWTVGERCVVARSILAKPKIRRDVARNFRKFQVRVFRRRTRRFCLIFYFSIAVQTTQRSAIQPSRNEKTGPRRHEDVNLTKLSL